MQTVPEYKLARIHGSVGCRSTDFTLSDLCASFLLISSLRGIFRDQNETISSDPDAAECLRIIVLLVLRERERETGGGRRGFASIADYTLFQIGRAHV